MAGETAAGQQLQCMINWRDPNFTNMFYSKRILYLCLIANLLPLLLGGCTTTNTNATAESASDQPVKKQNYPGIPGADVAGLAVDGLRLQDLVKQCLAKGNHKIVLSNNIRVVDLDLVDGLKPLSTPDAIRNVTVVDLSGFPLTDEMLAPISSLHLQKLKVAEARLSNLEAVKPMIWLEALNVRANPLKHEAFEVISSLPKLSDLQISDTPVKTDDLRLLMRNKNLKVLLLNGCPNISESDIAMLRKALPLCVISHLGAERENEAFRQSQKRKAEILE